VPSLPFISCVWCTRTPHIPSTASDALVAAPPPPCASPLYPPPYPLVYWPPAYSLRLRASGDHLCYPHTSGDLDLSASIRFRPLPSYVAFFLVCTVLSFPQFPYCSQDARRGRHADPLLWLASLPTGEHSFRINHPQNSGGRVEAGHFLRESLP